MKRLRIVHVGKFYPPHMGGIETHLQALCRNLAEQHEVTAIVANDGPETAFDTDGKVAVQRIGTKKTIASAPCCPGMVAAIRRAKPDVIHLHLPNPFACAAVLLNGLQAPIVTTYHSDTVRQKLLGRMFEPFLRLTLRASAAVICTSQRYLETSPTAWRYRSKCFVIPYGIPRSADADPAHVELIRKRFGPNIVLAVGRLVYYKGFEYLIEAMRDVPGHLLIVGDGPLKRQLLTGAVLSGVEKRVTFLGEVQNHELAPYYRAADVFALPSIARSEAFGIVQLEAMASGTPVINTDLDSGVPSVSRNGETGFTVRQRDSSALAEAIKTLLQDPTLRANFGSIARARVQDEFTVERMAERTTAIYHAVSSGRRLTTEAAQTAKSPVFSGQHAEVLQAKREAAL